MKITIAYYSRGGRTKAMAEKIAEGARAVAGTEVGVFAIDAECCDLNRFMVDHDGYCAVFEACLNDWSLAEYSQNFLRGGIGAHIPVFRGDSQQAVAHTTTHDIGLESELFEFFDNVSCVFG